MYRAMFNILLIVMCTLSIIMLAIVLPNECIKTFKKGHMTYRVIGILLALFMTTLTMTSFDFTGKPCANGEVIDISIQGSYAGIHDTYNIKIKDNNGNLRSYTSLFSKDSSAFKNMEFIDVGDEIKIYGSTFTALFYKVDIIQENTGDG